MEYSRNIRRDIMSAEQMQIMLDALRSMGEAGSLAFIYWLVIDKLVPAVLLAGFGVFLVAKIHAAVKTALDNDSNTSLVKNIREMFGMGMDGYIVSDGERRQIVEKIRRLMAKP